MRQLIDKLKIIYPVLALCSLAIFSGCDDEDDSPSVTAPTANAGTTQTVDIEKMVTLDGSASTGDDVTYAWAVKDPDDADVTLSDATMEMPTFRAMMPGTYTATLTVTNDGGSDATTIDIMVSNPTYSLADQMGRPAINTVFNFFGSADAKNGYNQTLPEDGNANATSFKGILDALQGYIGLDANTYKNVLGLDNTTTATVLATDVLMSNKTASSTYGPSDLNDIILGENVLNGRGLGDDVVDVTLILTFAGDDLSDMSETQQGLISDNVVSNDKDFLSGFPYLAAPH